MMGGTSKGGQSQQQLVQESGVQQTGANPASGQRATPWAANDQWLAPPLNTRVATQGKGAPVSGKGGQPQAWNAQAAYGQPQVQSSLGIQNVQSGTPNYGQGYTGPAQGGGYAQIPDALAYWLRNNGWNQNQNASGTAGTGSGAAETAAGSPGAGTGGESSGAVDFGGEALAPAPAGGAAATAPAGGSTATPSAPAAAPAPSGNPMQDFFKQRADPAYYGYANDFAGYYVPKPWQGRQLPIGAFKSLFPNASGTDWTKVKPENWGKDWVPVGPHGNVGPEFSVANGYNWDENPGQFARATPEQIAMSQRGWAAMHGDEAQKKQHWDDRKAYYEKYLWPFLDPNR